MNMSNHNVKKLDKFKSITTEVFALTLGLGMHATDGLIFFLEHHNLDRK